MKAEIISIGTEILLGEIVDTNASYLAGQLPLLGIELERVTQIGDNKNKLVEILKHTWERSDIIITTGGLGPTEDDVTRDAIATFLNEEMKVDVTLLEELRAFFKRYGILMPESNIKQAMLIPSACSLPNPQGTCTRMAYREGR